jgi:hypothetical protein
MTKKMKLLALLSLLFITVNTVAAKFVYCFKTGYEGDKWYCVVSPTGSCRVEGYVKDPTGGGSYCDNLRLVPYKLPTIFVDKNNNAMVDDGTGSITKIASDKMTTILNKREKYTLEEIAQLIKDDDGVVADATIKAFAKDINAKIVKVSKLPKANNCPACKKIITV